MSWRLKPVSLLKNFAAGLSVFTLCMSPVAQGAAAADQKKLINRYLKETGLTTKKMTASEYWKLVRHMYPPKLQKQMDQWVAKYPNEIMPSITATSFKDTDGKDQVRLTLSKNGQSMFVTFTGDEETPLKINSVPFSKNELSDPNKINEIPAKLVQQDPAIGKIYGFNVKANSEKNLVLTYDQFKKLSPQKRAEYLIFLRLAMESSQRVYEKFYGPQAYQELNKKFEWVLQFFFGDEAQAKSAYKSNSLTGKVCVVAGYLSVYGEGGSCGGVKSGDTNLKSQMTRDSVSCSGGGVPCNPFVYGLNNGNAFCVERSVVKSATKECNRLSPLNDANDDLNKKRIIESYLKKYENKNIDLKIKNGKVSEEQFAQIGGYLEKLNKFIKDAKSTCDNIPLSKIKEVRLDQDEACNELQKRGILLLDFKEKNARDFEIKVLPPVNECTKPGQEMRNGECVCPNGWGPKDETTGEQECLLTPVKNAAKPVDDSCGFFCKNKTWLLALGAIAVGGGLWAWLSKKKKPDNPVYVPPHAPPGKTTPPPGGPPPVDPPPIAPCLAPNIIDANGHCVPVPPPTPDPNEGGTQTGGPTSGGVRKGTK